MAKAALVIMAAGIGSRFGGGIKQLEPVGPNGEIIMDYSIYDAIEAGFDKVVFVIRKDLEADFREIIGNRIEKVIEVAYAFQEKDDIPEPYKSMYKDRVKPWGTGQAILCCKNIVQGPFLVINADDYYGKEAYKLAYEYLTGSYDIRDREQLCMVGFVLENTLSENGSVTRGLCHADEDNILTDIAETYNIIKIEDRAGIQTETENIILEKNLLVSMNMWGIQPTFFEILEKKFIEFLEMIQENYQKVEYLLPTIIGGMVRDKSAEVRVLKSSDQWFGVTYKEDKPYVIESIKKLLENGAYPDKILKED